jgi:hypothetical protein
MQGGEKAWKRAQQTQAREEGEGGERDGEGEALRNVDNTGGGGGRADASWAVDDERLAAATTTKEDTDARKTREPVMIDKFLYAAARQMMAGTYPKCHSQMLVKVPKIPPKYPKAHAQDEMLAKVPKMLLKYEHPRCIGLSPTPWPKPGARTLGAWRRLSGASYERTPTRLTSSRCGGAGRRWWSSNAWTRMPGLGRWQPLCPRTSYREYEDGTEKLTFQDLKQKISYEEAEEEEEEEEEEEQQQEEEEAEEVTEEELEE